jgi:hypothetical protein
MKKTILASITLAVFAMASQTAVANDGIDGSYEKRVCCG